MAKTFFYKNDAIASQRPHEGERVGHRLAHLPPRAVNVGADQLDDVARLDAERRTDRRAGHAVVVPDDQHLRQTCDTGTF